MKLQVPMNRVLLEGEYPCVVCGSGAADHQQREHAYMTPSMLVVVKEWLRRHLDRA